MRWSAATARTRGCLVLSAFLITSFLGYGSTAAGASIPTSGAIVAAATGSATGWWTVTAQGIVTPHGTASDLGDLSGSALNEPIVGMAATPDGAGYWLVASDGGVFAFGDARFHGSTGSIALNRPIVGMAATPDGAGYWLVASDGGVFAFGDARFHGSTGSLTLNKPIVAMASTPDGGGYWLLASDGGVFTFGDAGFFGSGGADALPSPALALAPSGDAGGYWLLTSGGQIYAFGDASYAGSPASASVGVVATNGGGYTVLTSIGSDHFGPAPAVATSVAPAAPAAPKAPALPVATAAPAAASAAPTTTAAPTTAAPAATSPAATPPAATATGLTTTIGTGLEPQVVRDGDVLREVDPADPGRYLDAQYRFTGVDGFELSTDWATNGGCGTDESDQQMGQLFSTLGPDAVVRVWFFQSLATNRYTGARDWTALDRVVNLADSYGVHIIATLANQDGTCDDGVWLDPSWYAGGYTVTPPGGSGRVSYQTYVAQVVARYAGNPAILAWEPVNEPRPDTCTDTSDCWDNRVCPDMDGARDDLKQFFDQIGAEIRSIDPNHLISDGALAAPGCGTATVADQEYIDSSPGIDLMSFHDYTGSTVMPASSVAQWNAMVSVDDKPVFAGENGGLNASASPDPNGACPTQAVRAQQDETKMADEFAQIPAFSGWLFWNAGPTPAPGSDQTVCTYETWPGDPLLGALATLGPAMSS